MKKYLAFFPAVAVALLVLLCFCRPEARTGEGDPSKEQTEDPQGQQEEQPETPPEEEIGETDAYVLCKGQSLPLKKVDGYYQGDIRIPDASFTIRIADKEYGFVPYSGAGGVGVIGNEYSALPYYNLKNTASRRLYDVDRAIGLMSENGKPFTFNISKSSYYRSEKTALRVRVNMPSDTASAPVYSLEVQADVDNSIIFDENFALCTCGGDFLGAYQYGTLASSAASYDGLAAGKMGGAKGNVTADNNEMFDYPVAVNSTLANETYMKNRGLQDWTFCRVSERPLSIQVGQAKDGVNFEAYAQTPCFSKISGSEDVCLQFDIARYSTASTVPIYVDIKGDGRFDVSEVTDDGSSAYGYNTVFSNDGKRFTIGRAAWTPETVSNTDIDKPVSHYKLSVKGATASTAVRFTATADNGLARFFLLGVRVTRNVVSHPMIGQPLPQWSEGYLDIHAVNTGLGECTFFIMPDGTTMCVDAGEIAMNASKGVPCRPNASTRPYVTYANYMKHFLAATGHDRLDYMQISHFHIDHMGTFQGNTYSKHPEGGFTVSGFTGIYTLLPFDKLIDRAYSKDDPEYQFIYDTGTSGTISAGAPESYAKFVKWASKPENGGLQVERFTLGTDKQLAMKYKPSSYRDFRIFNYCVNGSYWDGDKVARAYTETQISENMNSCGFLVSYGKFDYWTAGDSGTQGKVAEKVGKSIGRKVDAMKSNHHMSKSCMNASQLSVLQPTTLVTQSFYIRDDQPEQTIFQSLCGNSIYKGEKFFFFTNILDSVAKEGTPFFNAVDLRGHIVIRVAPGGGSYYIYTLDDTDDQYRVKSVTGPVTCD